MRAANARACSLRGRLRQPPDQRADPESRTGQRLSRPGVQVHKRSNQDRKTLFALAFSGGRTRAAAFSYGVLEELYRTEIAVDGRHRRLVDEVELITGVSGGSFTALSYVLYGDELVSEYEMRFLKRYVQGELIGGTVE